MYRYLTVVLLLVFAASVAYAQNENKGQETTIRIEQTKEKKENFYSVRFGAWFPKNEDPIFINGGNDYSVNEDVTDESQALGLDFHFRRMVGKPLYFDASASFWYTTTNFKFEEALGGIEEADTWSVIVPITIGVSIAPLPDNPFQPYAMAGIGAYLGFTGQDILKMSEQNEPDDTETYARFGFYLGAGVDFLFSEDFGLSLAVKYQFIEFQEALFTGHKDMTGLQATVGFVMGS